MNSQKKIVQLTEKTSACKLCHARELCMASCLSSEDFKRFDSIVGHRAPMEKAQRLFIAGDYLKSIFVLHSGSVKSYVESADGDNQITGFHLPGDIIGLNGVEHKVHGDTVEALETSSVCEIQFTDFEDIYASFPGLQKQLMRYIFRELSHEQTMLLVLGKLSAERRMAHFLLDISTRQSERGLSENRFNLTMTRHDIANYLGLAVETVSRILTRLQKANILNVERRSIEIKDVPYLERILNNAPPLQDGLETSA
jgi:CRP/FNR family transcriptional regulator